MRLLARLSLSLIVVLISQNPGMAQTQPVQGLPGSPGKGTVTGRVTVRGEPAAGVSLVLRKYRNTPGDSGIVGRAITDSEGNFRFRNVPVGHFVVAAQPSAFVPEREYSSNDAWPSATILSGETIDKVDLALVPGGVITGKAVDADGVPLTGRFVDVMRIDPQGQRMLIQLMDFNSRLIDDRGVYRVYGLPAGQYRVSVGERGAARAAPWAVQTIIPLTYHPSATHEKDARIIEVEHGFEATGVDIKLPPPRKTYTIAGRIVDAATGAGLANIRPGYNANTSDGRYGSLSLNENTDGEGRFRLEGFAAGKYEIFGTSEALSEYYSDVTPVEVIDNNVEGVTIKMRRGVNISGKVAFEGITDPAILARISDLQIQASVNSPPPRPARFGSTKVEADGSFRIDGLWPGQAMINLHYLNVTQGFYTKRIERNGQVQDKGVEVVAGRDIDGIRLVVGYGVGSIGGQIKLTEGDLPADRHLIVTVRSISTGAGYRTQTGVRADAQGRFLIEGLQPGEYEVIPDISYVRVAGGQPGNPGDPAAIRAKRPASYPKVTVANGKTIEVSFTLELMAPGKK